MKLRGQSWKLLALPNILLLILFFLWPLITIFLYSIYTYDPYLIFREEFTLENYIRVLSNDLYVNAIFNTFEIALYVTFFTIILAYPIAYYLARISNKTSDTIISFVIIAPMMISAVTTSFAWIILLSPFGIVHDILNTLNLIDGPLRLMFTKQGIIIALIYSNLPLMVIILRSALSGIDWSLVKSAYVLGASPFKAFLEVIIPLSLPGIFAGAIVTFSTSLSSFVTPFLLGGTAIKVMATLVYTQLITVYNWPLASSISVILFISTTILVGVITYFLEKRLFGWLKI